GEQTTEYHRFWWQVKPIVLRRLGGHWFFGLTFDANQTVATELNPRMASDPNVLHDGTNNLNFGMGPTFRFDSRDFPQNAYHGGLFQMSYVPYVNVIGPDPGYRIADIDYRQYLTIGREGSTLAWNLRTRHGLGDVPWGELGQLGSPFDLRGYRWGRYRDRTIVYGIVEYSYMV